jgi:hypothetical protein
MYCVGGGGGSQSASVDVFCAMYVVSSNLWLLFSMVEVTVIFITPNRLLHTHITYKHLHDLPVVQFLYYISYNVGNY